MVKKIRRKSLSSKDALVGLPAVILAAALFGPRREGRPLPGPWDEPVLLSEFFRDHFGMSVTTGDRAIGVRAFLEWLGRARWESLGPHTWPGGAFPLPDASNESTDAENVPLACLPVLVIAPRREAQTVLTFGADWTEIQETAFERWAHGAFNLIPGYDRIIHAPLIPIDAVNRAIDVMTSRLRDELDRAGLPRPAPFTHLPPEILSRVPQSISLGAKPSAGLAGC